MLQGHKLSHVQVSNISKGYHNYKSQNDFITFHDMIQTETMLEGIQGVKGRVIINFQYYFQIHLFQYTSKMNYG